MKDDYTANSHYLTYTFSLKRSGECTLWIWKVKIYPQFHGRKLEWFESSSSLSPLSLPLSLPLSPFHTPPPPPPLSTPLSVSCMSNLLQPRSMLWSTSRYPRQTLESITCFKHMSACLGFGDSEAVGPEGVGSYGLLNSLPNPLLAGREESVHDSRVADRVRQDYQIGNGREKGHRPEEVHHRGYWHRVLQWARRDHVGHYPWYTGTRILLRPQGGSGQQKS